MTDTFYCFSCWRRLPLSVGWHEIPPNRRKQCTPCHHKMKEARHALRHRAAAHTPQTR